MPARSGSIGQGDSAIWKHDALLLAYTCKAAPGLTTGTTKVGAECDGCGVLAFRAHGEVLVPGKCHPVPILKLQDVHLGISWLWLHVIWPLRVGAKDKGEIAPGFAAVPRPNHTIRGGIGIHLLVRGASKNGQLDRTVRTFDEVADGGQCPFERPLGRFTGMPGSPLVVGVLNNHAPIVTVTTLLPSRIPTTHTHPGFFFPDG